MADTPPRDWFPGGQGPGGSPSAEQLRAMPIGTMVRWRGARNNSRRDFTKISDGTWSDPRIGEAGTDKWLGSILSGLYTKQSEFQYFEVLAPAEAAKVEPSKSKWGATKAKSSDEPTGSSRKKVARQRVVARKGEGGRPTLAEATFGAHLDQLARQVERNGVGGLDRLYEKARAEIQARLSAFGAGDQRVEPTTLRAMLVQIDAIAASTAGDLGRHLRDVGSSAVELGARHGVAEFRQLSQAFEGTTPVLALDVPARFAGLVKGVDSSLLRRHKTVSSAWGLGTIQNVEQVLTTSAMTGKHLETVVDDVTAAINSERWKAERIVRTEMAYGYGSGKHETIAETARELEIPLHKRLVETFANGRPLDDRVGDDSFLLHGQTVPHDKPFTWKFKRRGAWVLKTFMHPPNRPNDRAVVIPWDPEWDETELERPLTLSELRSAPPTRWRKRAGVAIPPGHRPGKPYRA